MGLYCILPLPDVYEQLRRAAQWRRKIGFLHTLAMVMVYNIIVNGTIFIICLQLLDGFEVQISSCGCVMHRFWCRTAASVLQPTSRLGSNCWSRNPTHMFSGRLRANVNITCNDEQ